MAKKEPAAGHNSSAVASAELRSFIERIERLEADAKSIADDKKEVYAEAKGRGYDTKAIRKIIAERKRDRDDVAEELAVLDLYRHALGMDGSYTPDEDDAADDMV